MARLIDRWTDRYGDIPIDRYGDLLLLDKFVNGDEPLTFDNLSVKVNLYQSFPSSR